MREALASTAESAALHHLHNELARISSFTGVPQWFGASSRERRKRLRRRSARPYGILQPHLTILLSLKTCYIIFFSL